MRPRGRSISKVTQTLKNVNQDPQGCPTIPHDHSMCLHHPVGAYLCVLSTIIFPYKSRKSTTTTKSTSVTPTPEKTSDSAFSSKVRSTKVKLEIRNSKNWLSYAASTWGGFMPGPAIDTPRTPHFAFYYWWERRPGLLSTGISMCCVLITYIWCMYIMNSQI